MPTNDELTLDEIDDNAPDAPSDLRKYAKRMEAKAREAEAAVRENAFLRAGIDTSKTLGKAFLATYGGDLNDTAAILEAAKEFPGIVRGAEAPSESSANQEAPVTPEPTASAPVPSGTEQRRALADGAQPSALATADPIEESHVRAQEVLRQGMTRDIAMGEAIAIQARAVAEGKIPALDAFGRPTR